MPRVPYDLPGVARQTGQTARVSDQAPVRPVQADAGEAATTTGAALTRGGAALFKIGQKIQDDYNEARTSEKLAFFLDGAREVMEAPETGYLNTRGAAATGPNRTKAFQSLDQRAKDIEAELDNDDQRQMFRSNAAKHMLSIRTSADRHEAEQIAAYRTGAGEALLASLVRNNPSAYDASQGPQGPGPNPLASNLQSIRDTSAQLSRQAGESPEAAGFRLQLAMTNAHVATIRRIIASKSSTATEQAKAYLSGIPAQELSGEARTDLLELVAGATVDSDAWSAARTAQAQAPEDLVAQQQILEVRRQGGGTVSFADGRRLKVDSMSQEAYGRAQDRLQKDDHNAFLREARAKAATMAEFTTEAQLNGWTSWSGIPAETRSVLAKTGLESQVKLLMLQGGTAVTSGTGFQRLEQLRRNPSEMRGKPFEEFGAELEHHLDRGDMQTLSSLHAAANGGTPPTLSDSFTDDEVREVFRANGWIDEEPSDAQMGRLKTAQHLVRKFLVAQQATSGAKPSLDDLKAAVLAQVATVDSATGSPFNTLTPAEMRQARIKVIRGSRTYTVLGPGVAPSYGDDTNSEVVYDQAEAERLMESAVLAAKARRTANATAGRPNAPADEFLGDATTAGFINVLVDRQHELNEAAAADLRRRIDARREIRRAQGRAAEKALSDDAPYLIDQVRGIQRRLDARPLPPWVEGKK